MITWTLSSSNRPQFIQQVERLDPTQLWVATIVPYKSKRTNDQNSRLWKLYAELGNHIGLNAEEVHQLMGYKFLRYQKDVKGNPQEFIKSTTKLNTKEMAEYQDAIERWAMDLGFYFEDSL